MAQVTRSRSTPVSAQAVFDVLADFGALSAWADNVDHSCVLNHGPDGALVGTSRRVQVGRNALKETVTECEPGAVLGYDIEGLPRRLGRLHNRWELRPAGSGTEVTLVSTVDAGSGPLATALEWVVGRVMVKQSDSMLSGLARKLEARTVEGKP